MADSAKFSESSQFSGLSEIFESSVNLVESLENTEHPSVSHEYQVIVSKGIESFERATHMLNEIGVFSPNETIEEVATSDIKYLLLPALLGYFNSKGKFTTRKNRLDQLKLTELYYKDFLKRCKSYELPDVNIPEINDDDDEEKEKSNNHVLQDQQSSNLQRMFREREATINNYNRTKEVERRLSELKIALSSDNDETKREYYLLWLKRWVLRALEELQSIKTEKSVLEGMTKGPLEPKNEKKQQRKELKPVIIVRTELQKKVFGLGYPSLPTLTVDEFYKQRYPDSEAQNTQDSALRSMQQMAYDPDATKRRYEAEDIEEEEKFDRDDPQTLLKARAFDDWKDENRRGSGNRKNKG